MLINVGEHRYQVSGLTGQRVHARQGAFYPMANEQPRERQFGTYAGLQGGHV